VGYAMVLSRCLKRAPHSMIPNFSIEQSEVKSIRSHNCMIAADPVRRNLAILYGTKPSQISSDSAFRKQPIRRLPYFDSNSSVHVGGIVGRGETREYSERHAHHEGRST
jgi:hypothetical protein